jgi:hypothetical protein
MKYIKSFKIFESIEEESIDREEITSGVESKLAKLIEDKARINVAFFDGIIHKGKLSLDVGIYFDNMYNDGLDISKYKEDIDELLSYLVGEYGLGFEFSHLHIDSDQEDDYEIGCPNEECGSLDIEYGEQDWYNNDAIMNTCNVCGHKAPEEEFEVNKTKNKYETIEEVKEFFSKPNGYEIHSATFEFIL